MNVFAISRNGHRYIFLYEDDDADELMYRAAMMVLDPELDFDQRDFDELTHAVATQNKSTDKPSRIR